MLDKKMGSALLGIARSERRAEHPPLSFTTRDSLQPKNQPSKGLPRAAKLEQISLALIL